MSIDSDPTIATRENKQYELKYMADYDECIKRKHIYNNNKIKAYALLWERCAKIIQNKISARVDYETKIYDNPIELLKAIQEHAMDYQETKYEMSIIVDALKAMMTTKQREGENLAEYTRRFKTAKDVLESHIGGPLILTKYIKGMDDYINKDSTSFDKCCKEANARLFAFLYLENSDQVKYGSIMQNLVQQKSLGNDQYPKTIAEANNVLSNHWFDVATSKKHAKQESTKDKESDEAPKLTFAQMEGKCYCCGKGGHKSPQCRLKNRPKEEWAINKAKSEELNLSQIGNKTTDTTSTKNNNESTDTKGSVGWMGAHFNLLQIDEMKKWILLDNQSTSSIFCNPNMVHNIHDSEEVLDLHTNGGVIRSTKKCVVPLFGQAWFNPKSITNIISVAEMVDKHHVTYDSHKEDAFVVHLPTKDIKFKRSVNGLYYYKLTEIQQNVKMQLLSSLEDNKRFYSTQQFERASKPIV